MKKTLLGLAVAASFGLGAGAAQAAFLAPGSTGSITVTAGCVTFGVCQIGAAMMSEKGYQYNEILLHYFRGAEISKEY